MLRVIPEICPDRQNGLADDRAPLFAAPSREGLGFPHWEVAWCRAVGLAQENGIQVAGRAKIGDLSRHFFNWLDRLRAGPFPRALYIFQRHLAAGRGLAGRLPFRGRAEPLARRRAGLLGLARIAA